MVYTTKSTSLDRSNPDINEIILKNIYQHLKPVVYYVYHQTLKDYKEQLNFNLRFNISSFIVKPNNYYIQNSEVFIFYTKLLLQQYIHHYALFKIMYNEL